MAIRFSGDAAQGFEFGWIDETLPALVGLDEKTVVAWIEQDNYVEDALIMTVASASGESWYFQVNGSYNSDLYYAQKFSTNWGLWATDEVLVTTGSKHLIAVTYDRTSTSNDPSFYVSGAFRNVAEYQAPSGSLNTGSHSACSVGDGSGGGHFSIDGIQYCTAVFNKLLSIDELNALYNARSLRAFLEFPSLCFFVPAMGAYGVGDFDGHTFTGSGDTNDRIFDILTGTPGYQTGNPVGYADDYLATL